MSSYVKTNLYELNITSSINDQIKSVNITWKIPSYSDLIRKHPDREVRTNRTTDIEKEFDEESKFQLRIRFLGKRGEIKQLYYLAPRPLFLKTVLKYRSGTDVTNDYQWVPANKWQFLDERNFDDSYDSSYDILVNLYFTINLRSGNDREEHKNMPHAKLNHDLQNHFNNPALSDVIIKSTEGIEFHSHKLLLSIRSDVLRAHFDHDTVEKLTNIIESPFESKVLEAVLMYIYSDYVPNVNEMAEALLKAADFYQLHGLKFICEKALQENLTVDNVIEIMQLASTYRAENLKEFCIDFINDDNAKSIIETKSWEDTQSVELIKTIAACIIKKQ